MDDHGPPVYIDPNKYLFVMVSEATGAPTISSLLGFGFSAGGPPAPLVGLRVESPLGAYSAMPTRASGAFATFLKNNPQLARAKMERYIVVKYPASANLTNAKAALTADPYVEYVHEPPTNVQFATPPRTEPLPMPHITAPDKSTSKNGATSNQYHLEALNIPAAWAWAGGWGLIGIADSGLETNNPELKSFTGAGSVGGTKIAGGNFLTAFSRDISAVLNGSGNASPNADELRPMVGGIDPGAISADCDRADGTVDGLIVTEAAGHGTHVSALIAGNSENADGLSGVCKGCGIGIQKISVPFCLPAPGTLFGVFITIALLEEGIFQAIGTVLDNAPQVTSFSFGGNLFCDASNASNLGCLALQNAQEMDVIVSAASGNNRAPLQFPASGNSSGIGGLNESLAIWDDSPGDNTNCPTGLPFLGLECGSNYTLNAAEKRQEITVPAKNVRSAMYTGKNWNLDLACGDSVGDDALDGIGLCTGTSMSAPIAAGLFGLLRSVNPLVLRGDPESTAVFGVRNVVKATTDRAGVSLPWDQKLGYGRPNAEAAVKMMLGTVAGRPARNRATPLFGVYSPAAKDYAVTTLPQTIISYTALSTAVYKTTQDFFAPDFVMGDLVPGYSAFPPAAGLLPPQPRASAYVLSTEFPPETQPGATLIPLYWLDRKRVFPILCQGAACNTFNRDSLLVTSLTQVNSAVAQGYEYKGIQGYVYSSQVTGTVALRVLCDTTIDDCAVFPDTQLAEYQQRGYTTGFLGATNSIIGYAYPVGDLDADGLSDAMEYVVGTNRNLADSDADGLSDAAEFPQAGISLSDPCGAGSICVLAPANIFNNGFE